MATIGSLVVRLTLNSRGFTGGLARAQAALREFRTAVAGANDSTDGLDTRLDRTGGLLGTFGDETRRTTDRVRELDTSLGGLSDRTDRRSRVMSNAIGGVASSASSGFSAMARSGTSAFGGIRTSTLGTIAVISSLSVLIPVLGGTIMTAIGAIAAGIGGLPVLITGLLGPIAAVALGIDGIKEAAQTLAPEFEALRQSVSDTFAREMLPVFDQLRAVFPVLQTGLNGVAESVSGFAGGLADVVTSEDGLRNIEGALSGVQIMLDTALPSVQNLFREFLNIAGMEPLYRILGETIGGVADQVAGFLQRIRESGALEEGLRNLQPLIGSVTGLFLNLLSAGLDFFNGGAGQGLADFFNGISTAIGNVDWGSMGASFGEMMTAVGDAIAAVPPETWQQMIGFFTSITDGITRLAESGALTKIIQGFGLLATIMPTLWSGVAQLAQEFIGNLVGAFFVVRDALTWLNTTFTNVWNSIRNAVGSAVMWVVNKIWEGWSQFAQSTRDQFMRAYNAVSGWVGNVLSAIGGFVGRFVSTIVRGWTQFVQATRTQWNNAVSAVSDGIGRAVGWVRQLPGRILSALGDLGSLLYNAGQNVIRGLINGIQSMIGSVRGAIGNVAGTVRNALPFSPAKEGPLSGRGNPFYSGQSIATMLAEGMASNEGAVRNAINGLAGNVEAPLDVNATTAGGSSADEEALYRAMTRAMNDSELRMNPRGATRMVNRQNRRESRRVAT